MTPQQSRWTTVGLALVAGFMVSCGGTKRPPAVATESGRAVSRSTPTAPSRAPAQPIDSGPDYVPSAEDDLSGMETGAAAAGIASSEGGPLADIHFEFDRGSLTDEAKAILDQHAVWFKNHADVSVTIEGHCDDRGTVEYNLALGEQRARSALDYLRAQGLAAERMRVVSYGKERPIDPSHSEEAWAKNRRAHFSVAR